MARNLKPLLKALLGPAGLIPLAKRGLLETSLLGERLQFLVQPRPEPHAAILLTGPGRSGTTWLADVIASTPRVQQIFEPLLFNPQVYKLTGWTPPSIETYLRLYYLRPVGDYPGWYMLLNCILTGRYRTYLTDTERTSFFPKRYLVKEIRANLMLGYVYDHFQPAIIHITRHPCAVIASRMRLDWQVNLDELLNQEELVADYLADWVGAIERAKTGPIAAHAIWWAVESAVAAHDLATRPHYPIFYEDLLLAPQERLKALLEWLNLDIKSVPQHLVERKSRTTWREQHQLQSHDLEQRLGGWKKHLSQGEQSLILDWAYRLGITQYNDALLPVHVTT